MKDEERKDNTIVDNDYSWSFGIFKTIFFISILLSLFFIINFPTKRILDHVLASAFQSQPGCHISYSDTNFGFFMPSLKFKELVIPEGCILKEQKNIPLESLSIGFGGVSFSPLSAIVNIDLEIPRTSLNVKVASNGKKNVIKITKQKVDLGSLSEIMQKIAPDNAKFEGKAILDLDADFVNGKLNNLNSLKISSSDFYLPAQSISILAIPNLDLKTLDVKLLGKKEKLSLETFVLGSPDAPLHLDIKGNIIADYQSLGSSNLDLGVDLKVSPEIAEKFPLGMFLGKFESSENQYSFKVNGNASTPQMTKK